MLLVCVSVQEETQRKSEWMSGCEEEREGGWGLDLGQTQKLILWPPDPPSPQLGRATSYGLLKVMPPVFISYSVFLFACLVSFPLGSKY